MNSGKGGGGGEGGRPNPPHLSELRKEMELFLESLAGTKGDTVLPPSSPYYYKPPRRMDPSSLSSTSSSVSSSLSLPSSSTHSSFLPVELLSSERVLEGACSNMSLEYSNLEIDLLERDWGRSKHEVQTLAYDLKEVAVSMHKLM